MPLPDKNRAVTAQQSISNPESVMRAGRVAHDYDDEDRNAHAGDCDARKAEPKRKSARERPSPLRKLMNVAE